MMGRQEIRDEVERAVLSMVHVPVGRRRPTIPAIMLCRKIGLPSSARSPMVLGIVGVMEDCARHGAMDADTVGFAVADYVLDRVTA